MTPECTLCDIFRLPEHGSTTDLIGTDQSRSVVCICCRHSAVLSIMHKKS